MTNSMSNVTDFGANPPYVDTSISRKPNEKVRHSPSSVTGNEPELWAEFAPEVQQRALAWIRANFVHSDEIGALDSYRLKHLMEFDIDLYLPNGAFKGAMLAAGFKPKDPRATNWRFRYGINQDAARNAPTLKGGAVHVKEP